MSMKNKMKILLVILFAVMILPMGESAVTINMDGTIDNFVISDGEDAGIYITSNVNFSTLAASGSGILSDPYIISGFNFSSHGYADVYVTNTDAVFILENFNISHDVHENEGYGIYFENVTNALIRDGNIVGKAHSIWLSYCENVRVARMYISNRVLGFDDGISNFDLITASGVVVEGGQNIEIRNNDIRRVKIGIHLLDSLDAIVTDNVFRYSCVSLVGGSGEPMNYTITGNTVNERPIVYAYNLTNGVYSGAVYGQIILDHCTHIAVEYANLSWATIGLEINHCYEIRIKDSNMTRNWIGINAYMSEAIEILRCRIEYNIIGGHVWDTHNISIRDSSFAHNREKGVWLDYDTTYATIFNNVFLNNTVNAVDDGIADTYPPTSDVGFIRVKIVDSYYGTSLFGVNITLSNSTYSYSFITDVDEVRNFTNLALGTYNMTCSRGSYLFNEITIELTCINWGYTSDVPLIHEGWTLDKSDNYVEMYVKDDDSGLPIADTAIRLEGITNHGLALEEYLYTDINGFANFTDIYLGMYDYTFSAERYITITGTIDCTVGVVSPRTIRMTRQTSDIGFINVIVGDEYYMELLSGVNVTLNNSTHSRSIITDTTGMFNFTNLALASYNLSCTKDGYFANETTLTLTNISWGYDFIVLLVPIETPLHEQVVYIFAVEDMLAEEPIRMANRWFKNGVGNYWDNYHGIGAYGVVNQTGGVTNFDIYPLDEMPDYQSESELEPEPEPEPKPEPWSDLLKIYKSETLDDRVNVNSFGQARWKVQWASNETEIIEELIMMIRVNGSGVDTLLEAEYLDGWWTVSYNHTEVALLEFSVYLVNSYGMTEFVQLAENVRIIWDKVIVITTTITTDTTTNVTSVESTVIKGFESDMFLIVLVISIIAVVMVVLYMIKRK